MAGTDELSGVKMTGCVRGFKHMRKLARWTILALMLGSTGSTTLCSAMAQSSSLPLRGPIPGTVSTTQKSPAHAKGGHHGRTGNSAAGSTSTPKVTPADESSAMTGSDTNGDDAIKDLGTMSPPPIPPVQFKTTTEPHTNISIPIDVNSTDNNLLLHPENKKPLEPLSAVLSNVLLSTGPQEVILGPYHGLPVHVKNATDRPLLFNGDAAVIRLGNHSIRPVTIRQIDQLVDPMETVRDDIIATIKAGVTVGLAPTIRQEEVQRGPILNRYGADELRREDEQSRFGKRIIWPGDTTDGIVYFQTTSSLRGGTFELPVCSMSSQEKSNISGSSTVNGTTGLKPVAEGEVGIPSQEGTKQPSSTTTTATPALPQAKQKPKGRKKEHPHAPDED